MGGGSESLALAGQALDGGQVDAAVAHISAAIREFTAAGEPCAAAMACLMLGEVFSNFLGNATAAKAWFVRAHRLLEDVPDCVERGWVAVAGMGCDVDNPDELLAAAEVALDCARRFGEPELEIKALSGAGLAHVQSGRIVQGMATLDEAMALACGLASPGDATGQSVCSFFTACYYAADFSRAGSWADVLRRRGIIGTEGGAQSFLASHCDSVQATLLMEVGRWSEADEVLSRSRIQFENAMGMPSWHPEIALADLRVRQGRLAEAEHLLLGKEQSMQALLPAARLHRARGDLDLACAVAKRGLRVLGTDRLRAVELLTLLLEVELERGDNSAAASLGERLNALVSELDVPPLRARAARARALLTASSGDMADAIAILERAVDDLPAELAWVRACLLLDLVRFRQSSGDLVNARLDACETQALLDTLDVTIGPADSALLQDLIAGAPGSRPPAASLRRLGPNFMVEVGEEAHRLPTTKGLAYLAALLNSGGRELHVLDLVASVDGAPAEGDPDRRSLGDAGELLDEEARRQYRHRIEGLRAEIESALEAQMLETAESLQTELDQLVQALTAAFGLGGRSRRAASAAERARVNVTRAIRTAVSRITEVAPEAGSALDVSIRTGLYCAYQPPPGTRWLFTGE